MQSEPVGLPAEVVLAEGSLAVAALQRETRTTPIVFVRVTDPVSQGFVASLAHPGANVTGFSSFEYELSGKWLELLKGLAPHLVRVSLMFNPTTDPYGTGFLRSFETAAPSFGVKPTGALMHDPAEIEGTMSLCLVRAQTVASSSCQEPLPMFTASRSSRLPRVIVYPLSTAIATLPLPAA